MKYSTMKSSQSWSPFDCGTQVLKAPTAPRPTSFRTNALAWASPARAETIQHATRSLEPKYTSESTFERSQCIGRPLCVRGGRSPGPSSSCNIPRSSLRRLGQAVHSLNGAHLRPPHWPNTDVREQWTNRRSMTRKKIRGWLAAQNDLLITLIAWIPNKEAFISELLRKRELRPR